MVIAATSAGYWFVWEMFGGLLWALCVSADPWVRQLHDADRFLPFACGAAVLVSGLYYFTRFRDRQLMCCQGAAFTARRSELGLAQAWRDGIRQGVHCCLCCGGITVVMLCLGIMDLWVMGFATLGITIERGAGRARRVSRILGAMLAGLGCILIIRSAAL